MGWLEGLLSGYQQRHYDIETQKRADAEQAALREGRAYESLLNSKYADIRSLASAGILDLANPRRKKGGIAGWMGEMQTSPYLPAIQRYQEALGPEEEEIYSQAPGAPPASAPPPAPPQQTVATPPAPTNSAAMPATAQTQAGSPPLATTTPTQAPATSAAFQQRDLPMYPTISPAGGMSPSHLAVAAAMMPPPAPPRLYNSPNPIQFGDQGPVLMPLAPGQTQPQLAPGAPGGPPAPATGAGAAGMTSTPAGTQPAAGLPQPGASPTSAPPPPPQTAAAAAPAGAVPPAPSLAPGVIQAGMPGAPAPPPPPQKLTTNLSGAPPLRPRRTTLMPTVTPGGRSVFPTQGDLQEQQAMSTVTGAIKGWQEPYRLMGYPDWEQRGLEAYMANRRGNMSPYNSEPGDLVDPTGKTTPAFATFNDATAQWTMMDGSPIPPGYTFRPRAQVGMNTMGVYYNQARTKLWGQGNPVPPGMEAATQAEAVRLSNEFASGRATATGRATTEVMLDRPIGVRLGAVMNLPPTTTMREMENMIPLDPTQKARAFQIQQIEHEVDTITRLMPIVMPNVEPGVLGRLQTAFAVGTGWVTGDPNLAALNGAIKAALGNIAKIGGDTGTLSNQDISRAEAMLASLSLTGDTLPTAMAKLEVVKSLLEKARASPPGFYKRAATPGDPNAAADAATATRLETAAAGAAANTPGAGTPPDYAPVPLPPFWVDPKTGERWFQGKKQ